MSFDFDEKYFYEEEEKYVQPMDKCKDKHEEKEDEEYFAIIPVKLIKKKKPCKPCRKPDPCQK